MKSILCASILLSALSLSLPSQQGERFAEPTIIDVDGDGFSLTTREQGVLVDLNGDGAKELVAWTEAGDDDAFLAVDSNKNGEIDVPYELVGGTTGPPVGLALLASMDGIETLKGRSAAATRRPDGHLDERDAFFAEIILWTDLNHNGRSEEDELQSLAHAGIQRIATGYEGLPRADAHGNRFLFRSQAVKMGKRGVAVMREVTTVRLNR